MVLHVTFSDGSNPWLSLPTDRHTIAKQWRKWMKYHPNTASPTAYCNGWICKPFGKGEYLVCKNGKYSECMNTWKYYKTLGHALAALERLGGERP